MEDDDVEDDDVKGEDKDDVENDDVGEEEKEGGPITSPRSTYTLRGKLTFLQGLLGGKWI